MEDTTTTSVETTDGHTTSIDGKTQETAKTFTQADVDKIIQERLSRERQKYSDYDQLKSKATLYDTNINKIEKFDVLNNVVETTINEYYNDIEEDKKSLIPENLDNLQKLEYIKKNRHILLAKKAQLPASTQVETKVDANLIAGKYESIYDFSTKDPKGYLKWEQEQRKKF